MTTLNARQKASAARLVAAGFALPAAARLLGVAEAILQAKLEAVPSLVRTGRAAASSPLAGGREGEELSGQTPCEPGGVLSGDAKVRSPGLRSAHADLPPPAGSVGGAAFRVIENLEARQPARRSPTPFNLTPSTEDM